MAETIYEKKPKAPKGHAPFSAETYKLLDAVQRGKIALEDLPKEEQKQVSFLAAALEESKESSLLAGGRKKYMAGTIIKIADKILEKAQPRLSKARKEASISNKQAREVLIDEVNKNPQFLDDLSTEEYQEVVSALPSKTRSLLGDLDDSEAARVSADADMIMDMDPKDVAQNLELFDDIDDIEDYVSTLNAKELRDFRDNLSEEDLEIFETFEGLENLGPRVVKAEGSLMVPPEMPVDTYTPEDQANAEETQLPDDEMEENYIDFVLSEALQPEEQDYLTNALAADPQLSEIFDKVVETASEFSGSGEVEGPGTGVSDSIPARLSDGEFVMTRKATDQIGADNLQRMMDDAERAYDGGLKKMNLGGYMEPEESVKNSTDEEVERLMMASNRIPSVR